MATPSNAGDKFLLQWTKANNNPEVNAPTNLGSLAGFRDPTTAWLQADNRYYMLVGSGFNNQGAALLFSSTDMQTWTFGMNPF